MVDDDDYEGSELAQLANKARMRGAVIVRTTEKHDWVTRSCCMGAVALLGFMCVAAWNNNREMGEIQEALRASANAGVLQAQATDRRITALELRVERIMEGR